MMWEGSIPTDGRAAHSSGTGGSGAGGSGGGRNAVGALEGSAVAPAPPSLEAWHLVSAMYLQGAPFEGLRQILMHPAVGGGGRGGPPAIGFPIPLPLHLIPGYKQRPLSRGPSLVDFQRSAPPNEERGKKEEEAEDSEDFHPIIRFLQGGWADKGGSHRCSRRRSLGGLSRFAGWLCDCGGGGGGGGKEGDEGGVPLLNPLDLGYYCGEPVDRWVGGSGMLGCQDCS